eukprot:COSAG02_NODE_53268_length_303_cov_0.509804_1_plen_85_part_10
MGMGGEVRWAESVVDHKRSKNGLVDRLAWSSTRWLKLSQLNSRLKYVCFDFFMIDYLQSPARFPYQKYLRTGFVPVVVRCVLLRI